MEKKARKQSADPAQEKIRSYKDVFNKETKVVIDDLINFKKTINGIPSKFYKSKSDIKNPIPADPLSLLNNITNEFSNMAEHATNIVGMQEEYSKTRRKKKEDLVNSRQALLKNIFELNKTANINITASNVFTRMISYLHGPLFGKSPEAVERRFRISLLSSSAEIYKDLKKMEGKILVKSNKELDTFFKDFLSTKEKLHSLSKTFSLYKTEIENEFDVNVPIQNIESDLFVSKEEIEKKEQENIEKISLDPLGFAQQCINDYKEYGLNKKIITENVVESKLAVLHIQIKTFESNTKNRILAERLIKVYNDVLKAIAKTIGNPIIFSFKELQEIISINIDAENKSKSFQSINSSIGKNIENISLGKTDEDKRIIENFRRLSLEGQIEENIILPEDVDDGLKTNIRTISTTFHDLITSFDKIIETTINNETSLDEKSIKLFNDLNKNYNDLLLNYNKAFNLNEKSFAELSKKNTLNKSDIKSETDLEPDTEITQVSEPAKEDLLNQKENLQQDKNTIQKLKHIYNDLFYARIICSLYINKVKKQNEIFKEYNNLERSYTTFIKSDNKQDTLSLDKSYKDAIKSFKDAFDLNENVNTFFEIEGILKNKYELPKEQNQSITTEKSEPPTERESEPPTERESEPPTERKSEPPTERELKLHPIEPEEPESPATQRSPETRSKLKYNLKLISIGQNFLTKPLYRLYHEALPFLNKTSALRIQIYYLIQAMKSQVDELMNNLEKNLDINDTDNTFKVLNSYYNKIENYIEPIKIITNQQSERNKKYLEEYKNKMQEMRYKKHNWLDLG